MYWILIFMLHGEPFTSPVYYVNEWSCQKAAQELEKQGARDVACLGAKMAGATVADN